MIKKTIAIQTATLTAKFTLGIHVFGDTAIAITPNSAVWQTGKLRCHASPVFQAWCQSKLS